MRSIDSVSSPDLSESPDGTDHTTERRHLEYLEGEVVRLRLELERNRGDHHTCMETCSSLNSLHDGLLRFYKKDGQLRCIFANDRFQKMTGFQLADLVGRRVNWFFHPNRDSHRPVDLDIEEGERGVTLETAMRTKHGTPLYVLFSIKPFVSDETNEYLVLVKDIRALKNTQDQIKSLLHAERISTLGHLTAGIAHEINNPLSFLLMDLDRERSLFETLKELQSALDDPEKVTKVKNTLPNIIEELEDIAEAASDGLSRISEVVKAVKTFGKVETKQKLKPVDVEETLEIALRLIKSKVKRGRIELIKEFGSTSPVQANGGRLVQVFLNLLLNAIQAIEGEGRVLVKTIQGSQNVTITVSDTGKGIPADNLGRIFDPYYTTKPDGTGLGLGITKNIIHELGGTITVSSELGKGTSFTIKLPNDPPEEIVTAEEQTSIDLSTTFHSFTPSKQH